MAHHTYPVERADNLEDAADRYRFLSAEELRWALDLTGRETVADLGSGTGFYTDDIAPHAAQVYGVDIQSGMHDYYRDKGVPDGVTLVTAGIDDLPFDSEHLDVAVSTMTFHEFATEDSLSELHRVVAAGGRVVTADWTAEGTGEHGPPLDERYTADYAVNAFEAHGFSPLFVARRPETFLAIVEKS